MTDFKLAISVFEFIVIVFSYLLMHKAGRVRRFTFYSLFVLVFAGVAITGCSTINKPAGEVTRQSSSGQETHVNDDQPDTNEATGTLKIHFIDVGQADAILIQLPSGQNMLIDAGNNNDSDQVVNYLKSNEVKKIDHVLGTHPHEDHIGGLDVAIESFDVGKVYLPKASHTTKTYEDLLAAIKNKGLKITEAKGGVKLDVGSGAAAELFAPNDSGYNSLNNYSAVLKLSFGSTSFLFTGDAEDISEDQILQANYNLKADLLKVGHHGSTSSTSAAFLEKVSPQYAIICVGKDNDYNHPHAEILAKLTAADVEVYRTDRQGTIIATSNGDTITFNTKPASPETVSSLNNTPSTPPTTGTSSASGVVITNIDLKAELVAIKNDSDAAVNISGWKLVSEVGTNQDFTFPSGTILTPGRTIKVTTGPNATAEPGVFAWTKENIWNNNGDPGALYDSSGKLVSRYPR